MLVKLICAMPFDCSSCDTIKPQNRQYAFFKAKPTLASTVQRYENYFHQRTMKSNFRLKSFALCSITSIPRSQTQPKLQSKLNTFHLLFTLTGCEHIHLPKMPWKNCNRYEIIKRCHKTIPMHRVYLFCALSTLCPRFSHSIEISD